MSLITCTECGREISDKASHCVHCGCPMEEILRGSISDANATNEKTPKRIALVVTGFDKDKIFATVNKLKKYTTESEDAIRNRLSKIPIVLLSNVHEDECLEIQKDLLKVGITSEINIDSEKSPNDMSKQNTSMLAQLSLLKIDKRATIQILSYIRKITGLGLADAKALIDNLPSVIIRGVEQTRCMEFQKMFDALNAETVIERDTYSTEPNSFLSDIQPPTAEECKKAAITPNTDTSPVKCPRCGSTSITTGMRGWKLTTGFLGSSKTVNRCAKCGYTWTPSYSTRNR